MYFGQWHVYPPYLNINTILDWLNGPDLPERRKHLRRLVEKMGEELDGGAGNDGGISFARNKAGHKGAGAAVYVKLKQNGALLTYKLLGKEVEPVLWFRFSENEKKTKIH